MQSEAIKPLYSKGDNSSSKTNSWEQTPRESLQQKCPPSFSVTESGRKLQSLVSTILGPVSFLGLQFPFWFLNSETRTPKSNSIPPILQSTINLQSWTCCLRSLRDQLGVLEGLLEDLQVLNTVHLECWGWNTTVKHSATYPSKQAIAAVPPHL
jgi:hypothetical protein